MSKYCATVTFRDPETGSEQIIEQLLIGAMVDALGVTDEELAAAAFGGEPAGCDGKCDTCKLH